MADILQAIKEALLRYNQPRASAANVDNIVPPKIAQHRYTKIPIFVDVNDKKIGGYYEAKDPGEKLNSTMYSNPAVLDRPTLDVLNNLVKSWGGDRGYIRLNPNSLDSNTISHEATHGIYNKSGLINYDKELAKDVPIGVRNYILGSPTYANMPKPYAGSSEQISDEGLAYTVGDARSTFYPDETNLVNQAAEKIKDPQLKSALYKMFLRYTAQTNK